MRRNRFLILLAALPVLLAALANVLGNASANYLPSSVKTNALVIFGFATSLEVTTTILLVRMEKRERTASRQALAYFFISLGAISATLDGLASNFIPAVLPTPIRQYVLSNVVLFLIVITILAVALAILIFRISEALSGSSLIRDGILHQLKNRYNKRLQVSRGDTPLIDLRLSKDQEIASTNEWVLSAHATIYQAYTDADQALLILGEPGAGKTTLLVELGAELVNLALQEKGRKIPVIFSLASWAVKRPPLSEWMIEGLSIVHQVPPELARGWMESNKIIPLLDGLDEVDDRYRVACAHEINNFHKTHEQIPLVVCCRRNDYLNLQRQEPLDLHAVVVPPLTYKEVAKYLNDHENLESLDGLRLAVATDQNLQSVTTTPLMLSTMALAYQSRDPEEIPRPGDMKEWWRLLWDNYIPRVLQHVRGAQELEPPSEKRSASTLIDNPGYSEQQTRHYLAWLADAMTAHKQVEFYLERMQWDWLVEQQTRKYPPIELTGSMQWSWRGSVFWAGATLIVALVVGVPIGLYVAGVLGPGRGIDTGFDYGVKFGLAFGLLGFAFAQLGSATGGLTHRPIDTHDLQRPGDGVILSRRNGLVGGLVVGLTYVLGIGLAFGSSIVVQVALAPCCLLALSCLLLIQILDYALVCWLG